MEKTQYTAAQLGMLAGIVLGAGIGIVLFAISGNAVYIALAGAGAGIGLALGAGIDSHRKDQGERQGR
jgi:hypothetical protein